MTRSRHTPGRWGSLLVVVPALALTAGCGSSGGDAGDVSASRSSSAASPSVSRVTVRAAYAAARFRCPVATSEMAVIVGRPVRSRITTADAGDECTYTNADSADAPVLVGVLRTRGVTVASVRPLAEDMVAETPGCALADAPRFGEGAFIERCDVDGVRVSAVVRFPVARPAATWAVYVQFVGEEAVVPSPDDVESMVARAVLVE